MERLSGERNSVLHKKPFLPIPVQIVSMTAVLTIMILGENSISSSTLSYAFIKRQLVVVVIRWTNLMEFSTF